MDSKICITPLHPHPVLEKGTQESTGLISPEHLCMAYFGIQEFTHKYVKMLFCCALRAVADFRYRLLVTLYCTFFYHSPLLCSKMTSYLPFFCLYFMWRLTPIWYVNCSELAHQIKGFCGIISKIKVGS